MRRDLRRNLADLICQVLQASLPSSLQSWGQAIRFETADIPDDTEALLFAFGSLSGLMPRVIASYLFRPFVSLIGDDSPFPGGSITMNACDTLMRRPRLLGIACAIGAVALGLAYMSLAGAPPRHLGTNLGALTIGLAMLALLGRVLPAGRQWSGGAIMTMAGALLATALLGIKVDGAARWVTLGGLSIQPSLILLPVMLMAVSRAQNALATVGIVVAAMAIALQPDRAMAGMMVLGLGAIAIARPDRPVMLALAVSAAGFATTLGRADLLPASPFVDQILYSSFDIHLAAGMAVLGGSALLLVPAVVGWRHDPANRRTYATFGAVWFAAILAAALGNYPTPIVGYGGSAIIGYMLSLLVLPRLVGASARAAPQASGEMETTMTDRPLLAGMA